MNCHLELAKLLIYKDFSKSKHIKGLKCLLKNNLVVADEQEKNAPQIARLVTIDA